MDNRKLDRTQLKLLAIIAMVVDHTAWGFVEFMSPLGQIMHIFGRLTLPIMCFFIAEGYRNTSNLKRYIERMVVYALISILPFYLFFHEEYGYRQNIIFDLLLALIALSVMEHRTWNKLTRISVVAGLFIVSGAIGGWVFMPIIYVFIFYYGKDFKTKAKFFVLFTVLLEVSVIVLILLNNKYHFSRYEWTIQERLYLLGFVIALIPLYFYNNQKGKDFIGRNFFYAFYPAHFMVLFGIKYMIMDYSFQRLYIMLHVAALAVAFCSLLYALSARSSKVQVATCLFLLSSIMYVYGFLLEITTHEVEGVFTATKLEYFAESLVFIFLTFSIQELSRRRVPRYIYVLEIVASIVFMYFLFTYKKNQLFYTGIDIAYDKGPFPRMEIESYGIVFYVFVLYAILICIVSVIMGYKSAKGSAYDRRRMRNLLYAMICMWMPYIIKVTNLTNGYEIPALGVGFAAGFVGRAMGKYSYLDSVNYSNAINYGTEGVIVIDNREIITYHNEWIHKIFGNLDDYEDANNIEGLLEAFSGKKKTLQRDDTIYELRVEDIIEGGEPRGKILWVFDLTEHYKYLNFVKETAETDSLTGLNNRGWFENEVEKSLEENNSGAYFILDLDNFKHVNDAYGHDVGDSVLKALAAAIKCYRAKNIFAGRIGGDEFCLYYKNETDKEVLGTLAQNLINEFEEQLKCVPCGQVTSISIGIAVYDSKEDDEAANYNKMYKWADRALYMAKENGKRNYKFYKK